MVRLVTLVLLLTLLAPDSRASPSMRRSTARHERSVPLHQNSIDLSIGENKIQCTGSRKVVYSTTIDLSNYASRSDPSRKVGVYWSRLVFDRSLTQLSRASGTGWGINLPGDVIKITSMMDNAVQYLNAEMLVQWNYRSAYMNGGIIQVELLASESSKKHTASLVISSAIINGNGVSSSDAIKLPPPTSLCSSSDTRKPSQDPRIGRLFPQICTGWTVDDETGCTISAGHCFSGSNQNPKDTVMQSQVPHSWLVTVNGAKVGIPKHPSPDTQWAIDVSSLQYNDTQSRRPELEEDWAYFGTYRNPNTGHTFREFHNGASFKLPKLDRAGGLADIPFMGTQLLAYGHGRVVDPIRLHLTTVQQVSYGAFQGLHDRFHFAHRADTEKGNSGSPIALANGVVLGHQILGECVPGRSDSSNVAQAVNVAGLQRALVRPKGVCAA